jgi:DNA replication and repair protein RecF
MPLNSLQLRSFRNYRVLDLNIGPGITIFTGKNGIGKTTILESVSLLGSGRSFRFARNADFVHRGAESSLIQGSVSAGGLESMVELRVYPQGKKVFVDKKLAKSTKTLLELLPAIVFSPSDHRIIEGDSTDRKQFINRAAANVDWEYLDDLTHYGKALQQRNRILKDHASAGWSTLRLQDLLAPWDEQLVTFGSRLIVRRSIYLAELRPLVEAEYRRIALSDDSFAIGYQPFGEEPGGSITTESEASDAFRQKLDASSRRDVFSGSTQVGPHRDEILLTLNGNKVKFYGSQGEKRTCALALRLGELALFRQKVRKMPVLLFDDVSSELDSSRRRSLVELLRKENTQVLITATELPSSLMGDVGKNFDQLDLNTVGERN